MGDTKLTTAKIPNRTPEKKPKKLGLLTSKNRKYQHFRFNINLINDLETTCQNFKKNFYHGITKTDILEASLRDFLNKSEQKQIELLKKSCK